MLTQWLRVCYLLLIHTDQETRRDSEMFCEGARDEKVSRERSLLKLVVSKRTERRLEGEDVIKVGS